MSVFPERNKAGLATGVWVVKVMRDGVRTVYRTNDHAKAKEVERLLKAGMPLPAEAPPRPAAPAIRERKPTDTLTLRGLLPRAIGLYEGSKDYRQSVKRLEVTFGLLGLDTPVANIRTRHLDQLVDTLRNRGLDNKTINRYLAPVSRALKECHRRDLILGMPHIPRQAESRGRVAWLDEKDEPALLAYLQDHGQPTVAFITEVLLQIGFRVSELLSRRPENFRDGWLYLGTGETKNDDGRAVYIPGHMQAPLAELLRAGMPHYRVVLEALKDASTALGIRKITPHVLRHTTATRLDALGETTKRIKDYMGHRSINTTLKYIHGDRESLRDAAERLTARTNRPTNRPTNHVVNRASGDQHQTVNSLISKGMMEASPGIEPGCKDLQSSA